MGMPSEFQKVKGVQLYLRPDAFMSSVSVVAIPDFRFPTVAEDFIHRFVANSQVSVQFLSESEYRDACRYQGDANQHKTLIEPLKKSKQGPSL